MTTLAIFVRTVSMDFAMKLNWIAKPSCHRSTAFRRSCRQLAAVGKNAQIDQNADRTPLSTNWSRSNASALMSAATRRRWTQARSFRLE